MSSLPPTATPSRPGERLPFPYASTPPSQRTPSASANSTPSGSAIPASTSASANVKPTSAPISLSSLLAAHASAPHPQAAALDQALSERNQLSSQNSQLWKLIEKQRSGYNQMLKELERVRAERDSLRSRVGSTSGAKGREKTLKGSVSNSAMSGSSSSVASTATSSGTAETRPPTVRHHSDDIVRTEPSNRAQDPPPSPRSLQIPETQKAHKAAPPAITVPSRSESVPSTTPTSVDTPLASVNNNNNSTNNSIYPKANRPAVQGLQLRPNTSQGVTSNLSPTQPQYPPRRSSMIPPGALSAPPPHPIPASNPNNSNAYTPSPNDASSSAPPSLQAHLPASPPPTGYSPMMQAALSPPPQPQASTMLSPMPESRNPGTQQQHRESRISLPDEAKRYIASMSMSESPSPSPKLTGAFVGQPQSAPAASPPQPEMSRSPNAPPNSSTTQPSPLSNPFESSETSEGEFLDMEGDHDDENDDEEDDEEEGDVEQEGPGGSNMHPYHQQRAQPPKQMQQPPYKPPAQPPATNGRSPKGTRAVVEDFPLPPGFGSGHVQGQMPHAHMPTQQAQSYAYAQVHAQVRAQGQDYQPSQRSRGDSVMGGGGGPYPQPHLGSESHSSPYLNNPSTSSSSTSLMNSSQSQPVITTITTSSPAFRALPLLATDIPKTRISVSHSSIRPNDRGKEVLSFIIVVDPGRGKETWKVEKLYSDVLGLDQRIRASVGKGVGKKIASLPEGKLWRDHAPAKVDQRKAALETYLQTLINLPVKNKDEVIAFFCSDIVRETKKPVYQVGYKEGYLTKRGKNFGGWKSRYFVLQGPVLEYYESRGGTHLGSITITGAQIGRQQRTGERRESDDEKEYRHAFLIIEAKKGPSGNSARHVLCAESDSDRDNWVDVLVRYVMGSYNDDPSAPYGPGQASPLSVNTSSSVTQGGISAGQPRSSTSSNAPFGDNAYPPNGRRSTNRSMSKDDIAKGPAVPISQLAPDATNMKLFQAPSHEELRPSSPNRSMDPSPIDRLNSSGYPDNEHAKRMLDRGQGSVDIPLSSSLPTSSPLDGPTGLVNATNQRANSELGHYPDLQEQHDGRASGSPERHRPRDAHRERKSFHPTLNTVASTPNTPRPGDPEPSADTPRAEAHGKAKISGPLGGTVIPAGYKFGGKDASAESGSSAADRREKAKSRFWGFGKNASADKHPAYVPRAVFGVTLDESLDVAEIANLPAVVFRCIQYLEAKKADQEEGIYRLSGSSAVIKSLKDRFNAEGDVDLLSSDEYWDPHAIAGLLKSFLRELPASILTRELHLRFLSVIDFVDPQERIQELSYLIASLPIANYSLLRALTAHLILIVQNAGVNKMTMRNVGIVFSPTLGIPAGVFSLMLGEFNRVFNVDGIDEDTQDPGDSSSMSQEPSRRNSRQYTDAAADQLLGLSGRTLTSPVEEGQSDADSISVDYESPDSTEDSAVESSARSSPGPDHSANSDALLTPRVSKASHVAATRGLNIAVSTRGNRHSRIMGLPGSPRPLHSPKPQPSHILSHTVSDSSQTSK